ncbi:TIGR04282 family arsenosugar biosynthesis glycosyltransferase [soil metagenome]
MQNHLQHDQYGARRALLLFVRAPRPGEVKTRLAAEVGDAAALRVYRRLAEHALREAKRVASADLRIHYTPPEAGDEVRAWLGQGPGYLPQPEGDLGTRMERAFGSTFAAGYGRVVIVGSDLPGLTSALLERGFAALDGHPAVLGPAEDGGYWLLGLRHVVPDLFREIPWSTSEVLPRTVARLREGGIEPALLPALRDIDEAKHLPVGWESWAADAEPAGARRGSGAGETFPPAAAYNRTR